MTSNFPWQEPRPEQIRLRRALLDDTLIFDILLSSGGVGNPYVLYPPENPDALQRLLDAIESSNYDSLKKDCLIYFLLKWHQDGRERTFQEQRCIPPQFVALADAYWHLDTGVNVPVRYFSSLLQPTSLMVWPPLQTASGCASCGHPSEQRSCIQDYTCYFSFARTSAAHPSVHPNCETPAS